MELQINRYNEQNVAAAFTAQSSHFDDLYENNTIIQYKRYRVREHLLRNLKLGNKILELNAGTGDDAIFLARCGFFVHATDISEGMQRKLEQKVDFYKLEKSITNELCSYTALERLSDRGPYDCIFSNFAGLNCTGDLELVLNSFDGLLKPGGIVVLVVLPRFCLWETAMILKGKFKTASRRFFSSNGRKANIDGASFTCWYYSPHSIIRTLKEKFTLLDNEGLCTLVPPSYIEGFAEKYPGIYARLCKMENRLKGKWPWKNIGDYYIISFRKNSGIPE
jgi:ubiquinone/menaquinone biosynthesis C-methylase UbiE